MGSAVLLPTTGHLLLIACNMVICSIPSTKKCAFLSASALNADCVLATEVRLSVRHVRGLYRNG